MTERVDLVALAREAPVHFVGVAGAGVSSLAELVLRGGGRVSGCDLKPGEIGENLRKKGADIVAGHDVAHIADASAVITTAAVPADHPELVAARARGIPVLKRAAALGAIVNQGRVVAIAGTHGKTSTTAMTTTVLEAGGLEPTGFVGGRVAAWGGGLRLGRSDVYVVEADEYDRSFHALRPDVAVVTTLEPDHMEVFGTLEAIEHAFEVFLEPVPAHGLIALCADDAGALALAHRARRAHVLLYGLSERADLRAHDVIQSGSSMRFDVTLRGEPLGPIALQVPGLHNVRNALAALAVGLHLGVDADEARRSLASFRTVARRFSVLGEAGGVMIVDDYAHHPTEVRATLDAARSGYQGRRVVAVFQPHLYTRTRDFHEAFGAALAHADEVWLSDVFPAREQPIEGVSGELIAQAARSAGARVRYHVDLESLEGALRLELRRGDIVITMGAGDVDRVARGLWQWLSERGDEVAAGTSAGRRA
ncbi:MAG TPA: UDP-N-acetylmuramate--L-alanine ligase [Terriglobales bacterium]|nr:UDP-N-acetylmuramate--L-alanine ligase [Terriglobales bacterium]